MTDKKLVTLTLVVEIDGHTAGAIDGEVGTLSISECKFEGIVKVTGPNDD